MNVNFRRLVVLGFLLSGISAHAAAPLAVGDAVPVIFAKDQQGAEFTSTNRSLRFLLVATEMACAKAANQKLAGQGADFLERHHAAYLMDIHAMPAVARLFAFPKLRKYPQRIVLVDSAEALAALPARAGCVTVLALTPAGRIRKISHWNPAREPVTDCFQ